MIFKTTMKKNKKYWKNEAKDWKEVAHIESGQANYWSQMALRAQEERDKFKNELDVFRQYNIGKPYNTGVTSANQSKIGRAHV